MLYTKEQQEVLELEIRRKIYEIVTQCAGCHFREIQRAAKLSFGSVSYHLSYLRKHNLIREEKDGKNVRYFPLDISGEQKKLLTLLRQRSLRNILLFIFSNEGCSHQKIVSSVKLSPSTTTWHLKKLIFSFILVIFSISLIDVSFLDILVLTVVIGFCISSISVFAV